jgi:hypothetical protein
MMARAKVRETYLAFWRTEIGNAPHVTRKDKRPWRAEDFLAPEKVAAADKAALLFAQAELGLIQGKPDLVPDWAKAPFRKREKVVAIG